MGFLLGIFQFGRNLIKGLVLLPEQHAILFSHINLLIVHTKTDINLYRGNLPWVPWGTGYGPKILDTIGSFKQ
jgi:hypothetical protein